MPTQVEAYVSWKLVPAKAPRSRSSWREPRRRCPLSSYSRDHGCLLGSGGRVELSISLGQGCIGVAHSCYTTPETPLPLTGRRTIFARLFLPTAGA